MIRSEPIKPNEEKPKDPHTTRRKPPAWQQIAKFLTGTLLLINTLSAYIVFKGQLCSPNPASLSLYSQNGSAEFAVMPWISNSDSTWCDAFPPGLILENVGDVSAENVKVYIEHHPDVEILAQGVEVRKYGIPGKDYPKIMSEIQFQTLDPDVKVLGNHLQVRVKNNFFTEVEIIEPAVPKDVFAILQTVLAYPLDVSVSAKDLAKRQMTYYLKIGTTADLSRSGEPRVAMVEQYRRNRYRFRHLPNDSTSTPFVPLP